MDNIGILKYIKSVCDELNLTNSSKEKLEKLRSIVNTTTSEELDVLKSTLIFTYSPYIKFGVTSEAVRKYMKGSPTMNLFSRETSLWLLFTELSNRELTGYDALQTITDTLLPISEDLQEVFFNILDKNLKTRLDSKSINKVIPGLIPVFEVSLCNVYADRKNKVNFEKDTWTASRKLDGCRCITIIDENGDVRSFSRQGREFNTLSRLQASIRSAFPDLVNIVFDGEICIVDELGNENFKLIMKEITRKNHTIQHPMYKVFDVMQLTEFEDANTEHPFLERYEQLCKYIDLYNSRTDERMMSLVEQHPVKNEEELDRMLNEANDLDWEGLVIRKNDNVICRRSDSMLKVKTFYDAEYIVTEVETGPFRAVVNGKEVVEDVVTNFHIIHKGNVVSVGSGLSLEQRRYYKEHPEELIGKTVTIKYFEETENAQGNISLRFPTLVYIYDGERMV